MCIKILIKCRNYQLMKVCFMYLIILHRETRRDIVNLLQPGRHQLFRSRRLQRRQYHNRGPNHMWYVDGYDKLKPFGFAIHGAIDGWSRRIMWLKVASTNNNPHVICHYYTSTISELQKNP